MANAIKYPEGKLGISVRYPRAAAQPHWQPIETAPLDGTTMLLWVPRSESKDSGDVAMAAWHKSAGYSGAWVTDRRLPRLGRTTHPLATATGASALTLHRQSPLRPDDPGLLDDSAHLLPGQQSEAPQPTDAFPRVQDLGALEHQGNEGVRHE